MKLKIRSIGVKMWMYFAVFAIVLLLILWFFQTVFLGSFYESMKTSGITKIARSIARQYGGDGFEAAINELAFKNSILIFVTDMKGNILYASDEHGFGGPGSAKPARPGEHMSSPRSLPRDYDLFLKKLSQSSKDHISYKIRQDKFKGTTLVYGIKLSDAALYISSPLDPLDSTAGILRTQLLYVTGIALFLSFIIAFFISRRLSRPITKITETAGKLAEGNYDITFEKGDYTEIDELADTLNYTTRELLRAENLRRDLVANISHDFRTPLTMIKAYAEMIRDLSGENKEKRELHLSIIGEEAERLSTLVNDVLDLSLIQSGNAALKFDNVNLSALLKKVLLRFEPIALHEGYSLKSRIDPDLYVPANGMRLEQVFYNLIGNAFNHNNNNNNKLIEVSLSDLCRRVRFEVKDNGEGIPPSELPLIWDRYYKTKTHDNAVVGTGLGLSIVKGILELHGAEFGVNSTVGAGSTFWFELGRVDRA